MSVDLERLNLLLTLGRYAEGEKAAREAIAAYPEWGPGYSFLSIFMGNLGHREEAIEPARVGVAKDAADPWAHATLARAFLRAGSTKRAIDAAQEAIRLDPTYTFGRAILAEALCQRKRFREAHVAAVEGLRHSPEDESLLQWKGWAEYQRGRAVEALASAENGLRLYPRSGSLLNLRGCALQARGESEYIWAVFRWKRFHRQAEETFREAVRIDPTETAYQENRESNALVFRRRLLQVLLHGILLAFAVLALSLMCFGNPPAGLGIAVLAFWGWFGGLFLITAMPGWMLLAAPFAWLDRIRLPFSPTLRAARRDWLVKVSVAIILATVFVLLMLAASHKS